MKIIPKFNDSLCVLLWFQNCQWKHHGLFECQSTWALHRRFVHFCHDFEWNFICLSIRMFNLQNKQCLLDMQSWTTQWFNVIITVCAFFFSSRRHFAAISWFTSCVIWSSPKIRATVKSTGCCFRNIQKVCASNLLTNIRAMIKSPTQFVCRFISAHVSFTSMEWLVSL